MNGFKPNSGLSLLELLVALAIMAVIGAGLAQSFGLGIRVWETSRSIQAQQEPLILRTTLRDWIEQTTPPNRLLPHDNTFTGDQNGFAFLTLATTPFEAEAAALRVNVQGSESGLDMTLTYLNDSGDGIRTETRHLSDGLPVFSYYSQAVDVDDWLESWTSESTLPSLIRIEIQTPNWPEFTVTPMLR